MFCANCGNKASEGSVFCQKCGAKVVTEATPATAVEPVQQRQQAPTPTVVQQPIVDAGFKEFVDNHVRKTTKFKSAVDLIENSKPLMYMWIIMGVSLLGIIGGPLILVTLILGYVVMFITGGIIRARYRSKFSGEFTGDINFEDLFVFLDEHLKHIHPNFHNWSYLTGTGLLAMLENAVSKAANEVRLCTEYGKKKKRLAVLNIRQKPDNPAAIRKYFVDATVNGFSLDARANGMLAHGTLIRTAPILQAAMEYYLKTTGSQRTTASIQE